MFLIFGGKQLAEGRGEFEDIYEEYWSRGKLTQYYCRAQVD